MGNGFEKAPRFPKFLISISSRTLSRCVLPRIREDVPIFDLYTIVRNGIELPLFVIRDNVVQLKLLRGLKYVFRVCTIRIDFLSENG